MGCCSPTSIERMRSSLLPVINVVDLAVFQMLYWPRQVSTQRKNIHFSGSCRAGLTPSSSPRSGRKFQQTTSLQANRAHPTIGLCTARRLRATYRCPCLLSTAGSTNSLQTSSSFPVPGTQCTHGVCPRKLLDCRNINLIIKHFSSCGEISSARSLPP